MTVKCFFLMRTPTVICFVFIPDKNYILQIINKDNEHDDNTDSDMFCLGSRQMCRGCHPHKVAFELEPQMMMMIIVIMHCPRSASSSWHRARGDDSDHCLGPFNCLEHFQHKAYLIKKGNSANNGLKQNKHCLWHYVKVDVASMQTFSGPTFCKYRPCKT